MIHHQKKSDEGERENVAFSQAVLLRYQDAVRAREEWQPVWQECYSYALPEQARFFGRGGSLRRVRESLYDSTACDAAEQLAASLIGYLTPPWVNWFSLGAGADVPEKSREMLMTLLARSTATLQGQMDQSNLLTELHQSMLDLVVGGTGILYIEETPIGAFVPFTVRSIPLHEAVLAQDDKGDLVHFYRARRVGRDTALTLCDPVVFPAIESSDFTSLFPDNEIDIIEFCERAGEDFIVGILAIEDGGDPVCLSMKRVKNAPFILFRWLKTAGESYGRSPIMKVLPDIKTANKVVELILKNASIAVTGIWQAEDDGVLNPANIELVPGAIIPKAVGSAGLKPLEMPARFDVSQLVLDDLRTRIRHALMTDRFAQMDGRAMTATEVMTRSDEVALLMGAIYGRLQNELLTPLLVRLYDILRARGDIADLPLDNRMVQIIYQSPLARAQAARAAMPVMSFIGQAAQMGAGALAQIDMPAAVRYLAETWGIPDTLLTSLTLSGSSMATRRAEEPTSLSMTTTGA